MPFTGRTQPSRRAPRLAAWCLAMLLPSAVAVAQQAAMAGAAPEGIVSASASHGVPQTIAALAAAIAAKNLTLFATIDHASGAKSAGLSLRPTTALIFGNPKAGTPLMQRNQLLGLDLPLRMLVWQDEHGKTMLSYTDPAWLARRFGLDPTEPPIPAIKATLAGLAETAAKR